MEFKITSSFCLWELMFSLGRENTLRDCVLARVPSKTELSSLDSSLFLSLERSLSDLEGEVASSFNSPLESFRCSGVRGRQWGCPAPIILVLILSACVYFKRAATVSTVGDPAQNHTDGREERISRVSTACVCFRSVACLGPG